MPMTKPQEYLKKNAPQIYVIYARNKKRKLQEKRAEIERLLLIEKEERTIEKLQEEIMDIDKKISSLD